MSRLDTDLHVGGFLSADSMQVPANAVADASVAAAAGIQATKIVKPRLLEYGQNGTAVTATVPLYVCRGATGSVVDVRCGSIAANVGAATVTVDLKKNGTSILTGVVTLNSSKTARTAYAGTISPAALVAGDWLELVIVATAGGGTLATGLLVQVEVFEAQP